ncbi:MAG: hypothetical protein K2O41_06170 [Clostridia bacterium]|nr:hypothetical protein [Clostridia bacterium]
MNKTMSIGTQQELLHRIGGLKAIHKDLADILKNHYIGFGGYDLSEAIGDLELVINRIKNDVLKIEDDDI